MLFKWSENRNKEDLDRWKPLPLAIFLKTLSMAVWRLPGVPEGIADDFDGVFKLLCGLGFAACNFEF